MQGSRFDVDMSSATSLPVYLCHTCNKPYKVLNANEFIMPISHGHILSVIAIAQICYAANQAYCLTGCDNTMPDWEYATDPVRKGYIEGVTMHLGNPDSTAQDGHINWMADKLEQGWKYGPQKDTDKKTHPCLVEYDKLPVDQRIKDDLFIAIVRAMALVYFGKENNQDIVFDYGTGLTDDEMAEIRKINVNPFLIMDTPGIDSTVPHKLYATRGEKIKGGFLEGKRVIEVTFKPYSELEIIPFRHTKWLELDERKLMNLLTDFKNLMMKSPE